MGRTFFLVGLAAAVSGCTLLPTGRREPPAPGSTARQTSRQQVNRAALPVAQTIDERQCLATLTEKGVGFTAEPDRYYGAGCSTIGTVKLSAISGDVGRVGVTNLGAIACPLANTMAAWARFGVDRAARQVLGSPLARIETMGSYSCRNVAGSSKRSAHATGNAIDVAGFVLADGRRISVLGQWHAGTAQEREFLRLVHASACKRFGTVLGPGYNPAHRDHLHLERGDGSFCR